MNRCDPNLSPYQKTFEICGCKEKRLEQKKRPRKFDKQDIRCFLFNMKFISRGQIIFKYLCFPIVKKKVMFNLSYKFHIQQQNFVWVILVYKKHDCAEIYYMVTPNMT